MMRVRGAIVLAAGLPFWIYFARFISEVKRSAFRYELGSVAFPMPAQFRAALFVAVISLLLGLPLLLADFINWFKKKPTDRPSG
jgi:sterol desaturase/sphingolipid hydroxylase (fatty acid hydroxylase superfamily)